ncbi:MAG: MarR family winged helix-turn-helix transcriptional regulator [Anaerolineales bacterium]
MSKADDLSASILNRYLSLLRYQHRHGHKLRKEFGISGRQLAVLRHLLRAGTCTVGEMSSLLYISDASTSKLLERMERDGYIRRRRCEKDNRKVLIDPTKAGREIAGRAPMGAMWCMRVKLPELPIEELESIDKALATLSKIARIEQN